VNADSTRGLLQLAVFAAPPVVVTVIDVLRVCLGLTRGTAANTGNCLAPGFRNFVATVLAMGEAFALVQGEPGAGDGVVHAGIDLFLHGSVVGPTNSHGMILLGRKASSGLFEFVRGAGSWPGWKWWRVGGRQES